MPNFSITFDAMGSTIEAWLAVDHPEQAEPLREIPLWFEHWEAIFSRFRADSELTALNQRAGHWVNISAEMTTVLSSALDVAEATHGLFNPLVLDAVQAAGYDHSFDADNFVPGPTRTATTIPDFQAIQLDAARSAVKLPIYAHLDLGGIVKGWAAEQTAQRLSQIGACLIDVGGDLVGRGSPDHSGGWQIAINDPVDTHARILLTDAAIATSGTDYRRWQQAGRTMHHLIDPRTGQPAQSSLRIATVVASSAVDAEAFAKTALIKGDLSLTADLPAFLVDWDGSTYSNSLFDQLRKHLITI